MNFRRIASSSIYCMFSILFIAASTSCTGQQASSDANGPRSWIDAPLPGGQYPLAPLQIVSHSNAPSGINAVELSVNGQVLETSQVLPVELNGTLAQTEQTWEPSAPGTYQISVRAAGGDGLFGSAATVSVRIGQPPTATDTAGKTPAPEDLIPTLTPTATFAAPDFGPPRFSADAFYFEGTSCGPKEITVQIDTSDPKIWSVVLFFRLSAANGSGQTDWTSIAMNPIGDGSFSKTLRSEDDIPGFATFLDSILQVQLVATNSQGVEIARTGVVSEVQLHPCE